MDGKSLLWRQERNILFITASEAVYTVAMQVKGVE